MAVGKIQTPKQIVKRFQHTATAVANGRTYLDFPITAPDGYTITAALLERTANQNWIWGGINSISDTNLRILYRNEYSSDITDVWSVVCFFEHL